MVVSAPTLPAPLRLFGLTPIVFTDCAAPSKLSLWPDLDFTIFLHPFLLLSLFWLLANDLRLWIFTPVSSYACIWYIGLHAQLVSHEFFVVGIRNMSDLWTMVYIRYMYELGNLRERSHGDNVVTRAKMALIHVNSHLFCHDFMLNRTRSCYNIA